MGIRQCQWCGRTYDNDNSIGAGTDSYNKFCSPRCENEATRSGSYQPPSSDSGGCFIATAAYSTSVHPDLDTFREFRDRKLLTNPMGKIAVSLYYRISPALAKYIAKQPSLKKFLKARLESLAKWMRNQ
jgi:hypothetical protein